MNSRNPRFATYYDDQVAAYRRVHPRENIVDQFQNSSVIITGALLLLTVLIRFYSPDGSFEGAVSAVGSLLWDIIVLVLPAPFLFAADNWLNSSSSPRPMRDTVRSSHAAKSEALRRVMGLDRPGGMMSSVFRARTRALSVTGSVLGLKLDYEQPPGLGNRDNSCYQNSILQGLASLHSMPDYLATCIRGINLNEEADKNVAQTLRTLISDLNDVSNNGRTLWTPSLLKSMSTWTQQDAQEYYSKILDDIDKGAALAAKAMAAEQRTGLEDTIHVKDKDESSASEHSDDSGYQSLASSSKLPEATNVRNPLEGLLAQRVACVQCGHSDGLSMIPFNCLTLSLGLDKHHHDLYERLDSYSKVEAIEGVECPKCTLLKAQRLLGKIVERLQASDSTPEKLEEPLRRLEAVNTALEEEQFDETTIKDRCKITTRVSSTKTKQMVIARPPQSLVVHVNRSVFDPSTFNMIKNSAPVNFPMVLDLGPWCLGSAERKSTAEEESREDSEEQWELDPMASMIAGDMGPSRLTGPIYELRAAVTHYGRHENGHYICYRRYPPSGSTDSETMDEKDGSKVIDGGIDDDPRDANTEKPINDREMDWWRLSDHNVSKVDEELVMSLSPGVFMLFYECVDPSMILQSEAADELQDAPETTKAETTVSVEDESEEPLSQVEEERAAENVEGVTEPETTETTETGLDKPGVSNEESNGVSEPVSASVKGPSMEPILAS